MAFDVYGRLRQIMEEKGYTEYRLSIESKIPQTTLNNYKKTTVPSIAILERLLIPLDYTLSQFFAEDYTYLDATNGEKHMLNMYKRLDAYDKMRITERLEGMVSELPEEKEKFIKEYEKKHGKIKEDRSDKKKETDT